MKRTWILALASWFPGLAFRADADHPQPRAGGSRREFVDANGDGICDSNGREPAGQGRRQAQRGKRLGPRQRFGAPAGAGTGTGICDGTGPKGKAAGPVDRHACIPGSGLPRPGIPFTPTGSHL
jgi:hypothetical protein